MSVRFEIRGKDRRDRRPTRRPNSPCTRTVGQEQDYKLYIYMYIAYIRAMVYYTNAALCVVRVRRLSFSLIPEAVCTHHRRFATIITFYIYCTPQHCYFSRVLFVDFIRTPSID